MYETEVYALDKVYESLGRFSDVARTCARIAINQVSERGAMKLFLGDMEEQVAFPKGYLKDRRRFNLAKKASDDDLESVFVARQRPTSLARFVQGAVSFGNRQQGLKVQVAPGVTKDMPGAFLVNLNAGNIGLAIRLKPGQNLNKRALSPVQLDHNLYLLYGPSVDQVFRTVAEDDAPAVAAMVEDEFWRQYDLRGGDL